MNLDRKIDGLKRNYRGIAADPDFAERVTARVEARRRPTRANWLPAGLAAAALAVAVIVLQPDTTPTQETARGRLAAGLPSIPGAVRTPRGVDVKLPSLSRTRSLPVIPGTPALKKPAPRTKPEDSTASRV